MTSPKSNFAVARARNGRVNEAHDRGDDVDMKSVEATSTTDVFTTRSRAAYTRVLCAHKRSSCTSF